MPDSQAALAAWLAQGHHGTMAWMADHAERRSHPARLWPEARTLIVVALNYTPDNDPLDDLAKKSSGVISAYARRRDYHDVIKGRLKELAGFLAARTSCTVKVFVDTAPLMERPAAQAAGLGWQGKHTVLIARESGNWLFLGFILTTADLPPDAPEQDHCGSCRRCLDICPTNAFPEPYVLDARRCIAYLTIEHAGPIGPEFRPLIGNRIFGCDDCLAVCPWNKFAQASADVKLAERAELKNRPLSELARLDDAAFRALFAGTPVKRTGRNRFIRNVLIAIGNSEDECLAEEAERLLQDESPLVRGMAVWALHRLAPHRLAAHTAKANAESDEDVRAEWRAAGISV
ncbi:MAG: tRNA epoxyqueuosine(34) reductase QueG [Beijerinckiaceae bacterium]